MMTPLTPDQARALAALAADFRRASGITPPWDAQGIYAAIGKAKDRGTPVEIATATFKAASEPSNRTPAVIAMDGPHWQDSTAARAYQPTSVPRPGQPRCQVPGHEHEVAHACQSCRVEREIAAELAAESRPQPPAPEWTPSAVAVEAAATARAAIDHARRAAGEREEETDR